MAAVLSHILVAHACVQARRIARGTQAPSLQAHHMYMLLIVKGVMRIAVHWYSSRRTHAGCSM